MRTFPSEWANPKTEIEFKFFIENQCWKISERAAKCERTKSSITSKNVDVLFECFFLFHIASLICYRNVHWTMNNKHCVQKIVNWFRICYSAGSGCFFSSAMPIWELVIWFGKVIFPFNLWVMTEWVPTHCSILFLLLKIKWRIVKIVLIHRK